MAKCLTNSSFSYLNSLSLNCIETSHFCHYKNIIAVDRGEVPLPYRRNASYPGHLCMGTSLRRFMGRMPPILELYRRVN